MGSSVRKMGMMAHRKARKWGMMARKLGSLDMTGRKDSLGTREHTTGSSDKTDTKDSLDKTDTKGSLDKTERTMVHRKVRKMDTMVAEKHMPHKWEGYSKQQKDYNHYRNLLNN